MGLRAVLTAVETRVSEVVAQLGEKLPNFGFGEAEKYEREAPPRVTWVPRSGRVTMGDERTGDGVRKLWKRHLALEVRIWAEDFDQTEALAAHVFAAFTRVYNGKYAVLSETWDTESVMQKGIRGVFVLEVRPAFADEPDLTVDGSSGAALTPVVTTEIG